MVICSTCQGAQSECQQRLDADSSYRAHVNEALSGQGLAYEKSADGSWNNKNFLWLLVEDYGLDKLAAQVKRPLTGLKVGPFYGCYIVRPSKRLGFADHPERDLYLDWVIEALNFDMPFDQFTAEQLAGDMLPNATPAQRIATGFHRNTLLNQEGGIDVEEARWETLVDRVNTTGAVWLGSTIACAQCHNHKYDPFSQKDYFKLMAFFANPAFQVEKHGAGSKYVEAQVDLASPEQDAARTALRTSSRPPRR